MWGLRHKESGEIRAFFMHCPKTSGTRILRYVTETYGDEYEFKAIDTMYAEDSVLQRSLGERQFILPKSPVENHSHLTLGQAFYMYPNLKSYIERKNIDVFTMVRNPYDRFVSCLRFIPNLMISDFDATNEGSAVERLGLHNFNYYYTTLALQPQYLYSYADESDTKPYARIIHLEKVTGTKYEVTNGIEVDFTEKTWTNEHARQEISENTRHVPYWIPKFELDEGTRKFVEWFYAEDFKRIAGIAQ